MSMSDDKSISAVPQTCSAHDYDVMKPVVLATWKHGFQGACPDKSAILAESQVKKLYKLREQLIKMYLYKHMSLIIS